MRKEIFPLFFALLILTITSISCQTSSSGVKRLKEADEAVLKNLRSKTFAELSTEETSNATKILLKFFKEHIDYDLWYKNQIFAQSADESKNACEEKRSSYKKNLSSSAINDLITQDFEVLLTQLKDKSPLDLYESTVRFAQVNEQIALVECGDSNGARKAKREAYEKYLQEHTGKVTIYTHIDKITALFLIKCINAA